MSRNVFMNLEAALYCLVLEDIDADFCCLVAITLYQAKETIGARKRI